MQTALLVIDVQRGIFESTPPPDDADAVIARINDLTARARAAGATVIFVQHERAGTMFEAGSATWQLDGRLVIAADDVIVPKTTPDSFLRSELGARLERLGVRRLVISGYASEFCVDTTTRRAAALGYAVVLAADAHTTHDKPHATAAQIRAHHNATLPSMVSFDTPVRTAYAAEIVFDG